MQAEIESGHVNEQCCLCCQMQHHDYEDIVKTHMTSDEGTRNIVINLREHCFSELILFW